MLLGGAPCQMADPWRRRQVFDGTGHQKSTSTHLNARFCETRLETPGKLLTNRLLTKISYCQPQVPVLSARRVNPRFPWFSESKYITASVFFLLQLLVLGVPILVIAQENTDAQYIVLSFILFLMSFGTTLLIFIPKCIAAHRRTSNEVIESTARRSTTYSRSSLNSHRGSVADIRARVESRTSLIQSESSQNAYDTAVSSSGKRASSTAEQSTHNRDSGLDNAAEDDDSEGVLGTSI